MTLGRGIYAFSLLGSYWTHLLTILVAERLGYDHPFKPRRSDFADPTKRFWMLLALVYIAAVWCFATGRLELVSGGAVLLLVALVRRRAIAAWPGDTVLRYGKYAPSAASLMGYLAAYAVALALGLDNQARQRFGWEAACGVFAACYVLSGLAKLREAGWAWTASGVIGLLIAERALTAPPRLRRLRVAVIKRPWLTAVAGKLALLGELAAAGFVVSFLRWPLLVVLTGLQLVVVFLLGYVEVEWMMLAVALTLGSVG